MPWECVRVPWGVREGCTRVREGVRHTTNMPVFFPNVSQTGPPNTEPNIEPNVMMLCVVVAGAL